jgi:hypothetical protein
MLAPGTAPPDQLAPLAPWLLQSAPLEPPAPPVQVALGPVIAADAAGALINIAAAAIAAVKMLLELMREHPFL